MSSHVHSHHGAPHTTTITPKSATGPYLASVSTHPATVTPGEVATVNVKVLREPFGAPVASFDKLHTKNMHMIVVSSDLKDFQHLHPTLKSGTFSVKTTLPRAVPYDVFVEYDPKGPAGEQSNRASLRPAGAPSRKSAKLAAELQAAKSSGYSKVVGNTRVSLKEGTGTIRAAMPANITFSLKDARTGLPVRDLKNWLQMPGHAIVLSEDRKVFQHLHGHVMGAGGHGGHGAHGGDGMDPSAHSSHSGHGGGATSASGTELMFPVRFPKPGLYKVFAQFKRGSDILTADFVVKAE